VLREGREQHPEKACVMPCRVRLIDKDAPCHSWCKTSNGLELFTSQAGRRFFNNRIGFAVCGLTLAMYTDP
jgi:hypothetical protein